MTRNRFIGIVVAIIVLVMIVKNPSGSAHSTSNIVDDIGYVIGRIGEFFSSLTSSL